MNRLTEIIENKKSEIMDIKKTHESLISKPLTTKNRFFDALSLPGLSLIAEVKRRSPSEGDLNPSVNPIDVAKIYEASGASAVSVLTDKKYFGGGMDFLNEIHKNTRLPLLCKEFIIDPVQIDLAVENGASAVLLITDILEDKTLNALYNYARDKNLDVLVEAYSSENINRAIDLGARIIGINNRNLSTFEIDIMHSVNHIQLIPENRIRLSLSAVRDKKDAELLRNAGFDGMLVGSSLMKSNDIQLLISQLLTVD